MVEEDFLIETPDQLNSLAIKLLAFADTNKLWLFEGDMGAGKTTLIQAICKTMGVVDPVTSPTYSLVHEYHSSQEVFYHFDFYRIKSEAEALDIGVDEYLDSGKICFIEWPNKISSILPTDNRLIIRIEVRENEDRLIKVLRYE